jgi:hypothetical protein
MYAITYTRLFLRFCFAVVRLKDDQVATIQPAMFKAEKNCR